MVKAVSTKADLHWRWQVFTHAAVGCHMFRDCRYWWNGTFVYKRDPEIKKKRSGDKRV